MSWAQEISREVGDDALKYITDHDAYGDFHGGCGMITILKTKKGAERLVVEAKKDRVRAMIIGTTTASKESEILINTQFLEKNRILSSEELS